VDGVVVEGVSQVDSSPLTGESIPKEVKEQSRVFAGIINISNLLKIKVNKSFEETSFSKIINLTENALSRKANTEKFITKFANYYTPLVVFTAMGIAFIPPLFIPGALFSKWLYRALILLVISCPCALVISIPLGYFGGIGASSKRGILIKGSNFLDNLSNLKRVVFDKTGTLTKGVFKVIDVIPENGISREDLLKISAYAESQSNHPIAKSIVEAYNDEIDISLIKEYKDLPGYGIYAKIDDKDVYIGSDKLLHKNDIPHDKCNIGGTVVHVVVNNTYVGYILISDVLKEDAKETVLLLKNLGIEDIIMLTGDNEESAKKVADELGIDKYYAELLPSEKLEVMEKIMKDKEGITAFVGDGINDAPVIARADVGIAMGGLGQDAAIEAADVVIMSDKPSRIIDGILIGRKTKSIIWQNIVFALSVKGFFLTLGALGMATMWGAVFADVGVALVSIFNAGRILYNFRNRY
ncbi:MAG TPA: cadmium-translocating P-type ATPase, partial [Candidatus Atribacteria bacterium]|nr:cadmium-translocating P-type ATPase [Candidatus Atribacteria bacterium]